MSRLEEVTKKDIEDASMLAQLIGGAEVAGAYGMYLCCLEIPSRKLHDCPDCKHIEHGTYCDHHEEWDCVASAIGASANAVHLWMSFSNAIGTTVDDRGGELRYLQEKGTERERKEHKRLYAWVDSIQQGGIDHDEPGLNDLEVAVLLREGHLPPGWKVVAKHRRLKTVPASKSESGRRRNLDVVDTGGLPMVRVRMTASGPVAEAVAKRPK